MIITIGGNVGAGKTTLAAALAQALGYEEIYVGGIMRDMAAEQKMTIEEFYERLKHNPELERSVDNRQMQLMHEKANLIVQGRVAWFFAHQSTHPSFNIFLTVTPEAGAQRAAERPEYKNTANVAEVLAANAGRLKLEMDRYKKLYTIENFLDPAHYDFVLDTTNLTKEDVLRAVLENMPKSSS